MKHTLVRFEMYTLQNVKNANIPNCSIFILKYIISRTFQTYWNISILLIFPPSPDPFIVNIIGIILPFYR